MGYEQLPFDTSGLEAIEHGDFVKALKNDFKYPAKKTWDFLSSAFNKIKKTIFNNESKINLQSINNKKQASIGR